MVLAALGLLMARTPNKTLNWDSRIGRRIRLHDLHAFATVVQLGSISKAAVKLGVTQSAISQMIADLEATLRARLLDRSTRGVASTLFGDVLLRRSRAALDELRHGVEEISFLSDQTTGEVRVGCPESISSAVMPPIANQFFRQHPHAALNVEHVNLGQLSFLLDRKIDLVIARGNRDFGGQEIPDEVDVRTLFEDELVVAVGRTIAGSIDARSNLPISSTSAGSSLSQRHSITCWSPRPSRRTALRYPTSACERSLCTCGFN
ncbi:MAG TPA: LysR family transcriptional regulator [Gemmatimonadaceae bacterium]|nr:LysR family transcriptional regulator [Gemmatimonadaceae bacterium]